MLLPLFVIIVIFRMADLIAKVADVATDCNCYNLADVIDKVADVIATVCNSYHWQMLLPSD